MAVRIESQAEPIPGYKLIERLGGGGFGEVWKCEAPGGLHKAIKFVFGDLSGAPSDCVTTNGEGGHRAKQELKALSRVKTVRHPFILSLERYDIIDGQLLIIMELADRNLWDRYRECRTQDLPGIPREELLGYMEEAAEALDLMNNQYQLQHLDIKPQNLFLVYQHVKVADFGLVKDLEGMQASVTGGVTPVYAAPETFDGWVSRFSDQYSLAICYQELLTGRRPFAGANVHQLIVQHLQAAPDLSPLPAGDQPIIGRALSKNPDERHPTCLEMVRLLRRAACPAESADDLAERLAARPTQPTPASDLLRTPERETGTAGNTPAEATASIRGPSDSHPGLTLSIRGADGAVLQEALAAVRKAPPEIRGEGALFPALVVGVGAVGMTVLQQLRESVHRRFGSLSDAAHLRLLLLDTDPDVVRAATAGRPGAALSANEVLLTPLNRPSYYFKLRDGRVSFDSWFNRRMLYRIPRSQVTTGVRALGRLAFHDNYRTIVRRLQAELEALLEPQALTNAANKSGLGVRSNRPRIYLVVNLAGGTGGAVFIDLAYTLRAMLRQMGYAQPEVIGLLLLPPVDRHRTRVLPLGNACAALTELSHYSSPSTVFKARYHEREAPVQDAEPPFSRCFLLPMPDEADETATRELVDSAGQFLYRDLCTALGKAADLGRAGLSAPPWEQRGMFYQTFGMYHLAWPRHALLREAGRKLCQRMVQRWMSKDSKPLRDAVQTYVQEQWTLYELGAETLIGRLRESCEDLLRKAPEDAFVDILGPLLQHYAPLAGRGGSRQRQEGSGPELNIPDPAPVLAELEGLIGMPREEGIGDVPGALVRRLREASEKVVTEWGQKLAEISVHLIEEPEYRLAGAEEAVRQLVATIEQILQRQEPLARELAAKAAHSYERLQALFGPVKFGRRPTPPPAAEIVELLRAYPKLRYQSLVMQHTSSTLLSLRGHLSDELREINFCRVRLTELNRLLEAPADGTESEARAGRLVLPSGCKDLGQAVDEFLARIGPEALLELDVRTQAMIHRDFVALVHICLASTNLLTNVETAMMATAQAFAGELLGETNAADHFLEQHPDEEAAMDEAAAYFDEAHPELGPRKAPAGSEICVIATPPGPSGDRVLELTRAALPEVEFAPAASDDDVFFYREVSHLPLSELDLLGAAGQDAYRQMSAAEDFTPHTRTDVDFGAAPR
ncbi:MAG TPA: tubulin-like doman-containing protein [Gemmataceae bacterium]|nr:tubulin-like doman-containing protein [Gemmataceae bacterium]